MQLINETPHWHGQQGEQVRTNIACQGALHGASVMASRGLYVHPLNGKRAITKWKAYSTKDPAEIRKWPHQFPYWEKKAYGIDCEKSGLIVIDEDAPGDLKRWHESTGLTLPETLTVATGRNGGGTHLYYKKPAGITMGDHSRWTTPLPGEPHFAIDVRGKGYAVGPGSIHEKTGRTYTITHNTEPVELPHAIAQWITATAPKPASALSPTRPGVFTVKGNARPLGSPLDQFSEAVTWAEILEPFGWTLDHVDSGGEQYWTKPGGRSGDYQATANYNGSQKLKVFTPKAPPFRQGEAYTKAYAYTLMYHGGNWAEASKAVKRMGFIGSGYNTERSN